MKKIAILVCCHKQSEFIRTESPYFPIQVGKALHGNVDLGFTCDNEGDNISDKNLRYNEMTAIYWAWKNMPDVEYMGVAHYRRYLDIDVNEENVDRIFQNTDIICNRLMLNCRVRDRIEALASMEDTYIFLDTLLQMHPEYEQAVIDYTENSNEWINCTMFIARKEVYDKFCSTFFPVFFETEKRITTHQYSRLNRTFGYMGEFSLGLFIAHEHLRKKYVPIVLGKKGTRRGLYFGLGIRPWLSYIRRKIGFRISNYHTTEMTPYDAVSNALKADGILIPHYDKRIAPKPKSEGERKSI